MCLEEIIRKFVLRLEEQLDVILKREVDLDALVLSSKDLAFTIIIYYPRPSVTRLINRHEKTFHIDTDQIISDSEKIINRLLTLLGKGQAVYARQTVAARIDKKVATIFQQEHHLQAAMPGKYRYGLFLQGELVSIAVFSGGRHMRDKSTDYRSFELIRFCHKSRLRVVGGLSKLIQAFIKDFKPNDIMTYADRDWSHKSGLLTIGFTERNVSSPQEFWINENHRYPIQNEAVRHTLLESYPNGYLVQNSGSSKLVLELPQSPS